MILTPADRESGTWQRILQHLRARKQHALEQLANDHDAEHTWKQRGRIAEIEALMRLHEEADFGSE